MKCKKNTTTSKVAETFNKNKYLEEKDLRRIEFETRKIFYIIKKTDILLNNSVYLNSSVYDRQYDNIKAMLIESFVNSDALSNDNISRILSYDENYIIDCEAGLLFYLLNRTISDIFKGYHTNKDYEIYKEFIDKVFGVLTEKSKRAINKFETSFAKKYGYSVLDLLSSIFNSKSAVSSLHTSLTEISNYVSQIKLRISSTELLLLSYQYTVESNSLCKKKDIIRKKRFAQFKDKFKNALKNKSKAVFRDALTNENYIKKLKEALKSTNFENNNDQMISELHSKIISSLKNLNGLSEEIRLFNETMEKVRYAAEIFNWATFNYINTDSATCQLEKIDENLQKIYLEVVELEIPIESAHINHTNLISQVTTRPDKKDMLNAIDTMFKSVGKIKSLLELIGEDIKKPEVLQIERKPEVLQIEYKPEVLQIEYKPEVLPIYNKPSTIQTYFNWRKEDENTSFCLNFENDITPDLCKKLEEIAKNDVMAKLKLAEIYSSKYYHSELNHKKAFDILVEAKSLAQARFILGDIIDNITCKYGENSYYHEKNIKTVLAEFGVIDYKALLLCDANAPYSLLRNRTIEKKDYNKLRKSSPYAADLYYKFNEKKKPKSHYSKSYNFSYDGSLEYLIRVFYTRFLNEDLSYNVVLARISKMVPALENLLAIRIKNAYFCTYNIFQYSDLNVADNIVNDESIQNLLLGEMYFFSNNILEAKRHYEKSDEEIAKIMLFLINQRHYSNLLNNLKSRYALLVKYYHNAITLEHYLENKHYFLGVSFYHVGIKYLLLNQNEEAFSFFEKGWFEYHNRESFVYLACMIHSNKNSIAIDSRSKIKINNLLHSNFLNQSKYKEIHKKFMTDFWSNDEKIREGFTTNGYCEIKHQRTIPNEPVTGNLLTINRGEICMQNIYVLTNEDREEKYSVTPIIDEDRIEAKEAKEEKYSVTPIIDEENHRVIPYIPNNIIIKRFHELFPVSMGTDLPNNCYTQSAKILEKIINRMNSIWLVKNLDIKAKDFFNKTHPELLNSAVSQLSQKPDREQKKGLFDRFKALFKETNYRNISELDFFKAILHKNYNIVKHLDNYSLIFAGYDDLFEKFFQAYLSKVYEFVSSNPTWGNRRLSGVSDYLAKLYHSSALVVCYSLKSESISFNFIELMHKYLRMLSTEEGSLANGGSITLIRSLHPKLIKKLLHTNKQRLEGDAYSFMPNKAKVNDLFSYIKNTVTRLSSNLTFDDLFNSSNNSFNELIKEVKHVFFKISPENEASVFSEVGSNGDLRHALNNMSDIGAMFRTDAKFKSCLNAGNNALNSNVLLQGFENSKQITSLEEENRILRERRNQLETKNSEFKETQVSQSQEISRLRQRVDRLSNLEDVVVSLAASLQQLNEKLSMQQITNSMQQPNEQISMQQITNSMQQPNEQISMQQLTDHQNDIESKNSYSI